MSDTGKSPQQWPREIVRVTTTASGVRLCFPPLRAWRFALRLAAAGIALIVPALVASIAFAPGRIPGAAGVLTMVLTAGFVYPLLLFGAIFVVVALVSVSTSLTVDANAQGIRAVRRVFGIRLRDRTLPHATIAALELETATAPRGLGGKVYHRIVALTLPSWNGSRSSARPAVGRTVVADGIPDEETAQALEALIRRHAAIGELSNVPSAGN